MEWVTDPDVWLGLFVLFGIPLWLGLSRKYEWARLSWKAFRIAAVTYAITGIVLFVAYHMGIVPRWAVPFVFNTFISREYTLISIEP